MITKPPLPGKPAAKQGDLVVGIDTHIVMVPSPAGPVPTATPMPFSGSPFTPTSLRNAHKSLEQFSDISAKRGECGAPGLFRRGEAPVSREGGPYRE